jgi:hypothetical protein
MAEDGLTRARLAAEPSIGLDAAAAVPFPFPSASAASAPSVSERSQWDRITLAPDVELHVRRPLTRDMNRRIEKLLDAARDLLKEK